MVLYLYFIYLSAHLSFAFEDQDAYLKEAKRDYQNAEEKYVSALAGFAHEEIITQNGFVKVSAEQFVSRRTSVALRQ